MDGAVALQLGGGTLSLPGSQTKGLVVNALSHIILQVNGSNLGP